MFLSLRDVGFYMAAITVVIAASTILVGILTNVVGVSRLLIFSTLMMMAGFLFLGPIALLNGVVPRTVAQTVAANVAVAIGAGGISVPISILVLFIYKAHGYSKIQVAGVSGSIFTATQAFGTTVGAPIGGMPVELRVPCRRSPC